MNTHARTIRSILAASFVCWLLPAGVTAESTTYQINMTGDQEVPGPGDPDGMASGALTIDDATGMISWEFTYSGIAEPAAMHIHTGAASEGGGVVIPLNVETSGGSGTLVGSTTVNPADVAPIVASPESYYVNIHNAEHRGGAVRGQLAE